MEHGEECTPGRSVIYSTRRSSTVNTTLQCPPSSVNRRPDSAHLIGEDPRVVALLARELDDAV